MRPKDWFKLACRVPGMWQLVDTAGYGTQRLVLVF